MTQMWTGYRLEFEGGSPARNWCPLPSKLSKIPGFFIKVDPDGFAEIKPHTKTGIRKGLTQLAMTSGEGRERRGWRPRKGMVLVTYMAEDENGNPVTRGPAPRVHVFATRYEPNTTVTELLRNKEWQDLGFFPPIKSVNVTVDDTDIFGRAVETRIRFMFKEKVLKRQNVQLLGSARDRGADAWWELSQFYSELARELGDPFYADLASELTSLGREAARWDAA